MLVCNSIFIDKGEQKDGEVDRNHDFTDGNGRCIPCWACCMEWCVNISQITSKDDEALCYLSMLVTVELAAEIHRNKPNTAIRKTVARLLPRMNHPRVRAIMVGLARQAYPSGALIMLRRTLEEAVDGVVSFE